MAKSKKALIRKTPAKKVLSEKTVLYHASIKVFGKTFTAEGSSVKEAIGNLKPGVARGVSILTITHGDVKQDRIFASVLTARLFSSSGLVREINLKQAASRFGI